MNELLLENFSDLMKNINVNEYWMKSTDIIVQMEVVEKSFSVEK